MALSPAGPEAPESPKIQSLDAALARRAAEAPGALAFAFHGGEAGGDERSTYGELAAAVERLAGGLARLGVGRGDRVSLHLPAGLGFVRAFFALQRLGAIPCAISPDLPPATGARRAGRVRPRLVLAGGPRAAELLAACNAAGLRAEHPEEAARGAAPAPPRIAPRIAIDPSDVAFLQPTSGTSGEPLAAVVTQANVLASLAAARARLAIGPADVLAGWVPPWHDLGLLRFVLAPVCLGVPCHLVPPAIRTLPLWLQTAAAVRATLTGAPDFAYRLAARLVDPRGLDLGSLRYATNGGEPVRRTTVAAFEERFGLPGVVRPGYGLAEATLGVTALAPGEPLRADERGNVSCGRPLPGVEVRIAPEPGEPPGGPQVPDLPGEILVRGPAVFSGYFGDAAATRAALRGGWLHTGDLGALDGDGHLYVLGRRRAMLKRGGVPLAPRELEEAAEQVPGLRLAAAVGLPPADGAASEEIVLAVEAAPAAAPAPLAAAAAAAVEAALGFAPERVLVLAPRAIPRTPNGKTRHQALARALQAGELERQGSILFSSRPG